MSYLPASSASNLSAYYTHWLKVASKGNVTYTVAWATDRMMLHCGECDQTLVVSTPKDTTVVDYAVQEYVKLHRHESPDKVDIGLSKVAATVLDGRATPVTADFKPVKRKKKDWDITEGRRFR